MRFKPLLYIVILLYCACNCFADTKNLALDAKANFIALADIHFDPFFACQNNKTCILALRQAAGTDWAKIFAKYDTGFPAYRKDTNYKLLSVTLQAAKQVAEKEHARFVIVLGDFFGHDLRRSYRRYTHDNSRDGYRSFIKKMMTFLTAEIAKAFPQIDVYPLIGNNDTYIRDYYHERNGVFLQDAASLWATLIKTPSNRENLQSTFPRDGYYAVMVPGFTKLRILVLNSVIFSSSAKGKNIGAAADAQLLWLHKQLQYAKDQHMKTIIMMHIPPGIDVYATLRFKLFTLVSLWQAKYTQAFYSELKAFAPQILAIFAGHLHANRLQMLSFTGIDSDIPSVGVTSISPIFGNNPGFKLYPFSSDALAWDKAIRYSLPLQASLTWQSENDYH